MRSRETRPAAAILEPEPQASTLALYLIIVLGAGALVIAALIGGSSLFDGATVFTPPPLPDEPPLFLHFIVALLAIILSARALGWLLRLAGQPAVIGEILAGLLLGPTLLGRHWPATVPPLFPETLMPVLQVIAEFGIVLYMFKVGLELDAAPARRRGPLIALLSHSAIAVPFAAGVLCSLWLYPSFATAQTAGFIPFALFMGVAMAITALPVLARILEDSGMSQSPLAQLALPCAALGDLTSWILLSLIIAALGPTLGSPLATVLGALAAVGLAFAIRPWLARLAQRRFDHGGFLQALVIVLCFALLTEHIGLHALFGAFLVGALIPRGSPLATGLSGRGHDLVRAVFLPVFFACAGLQADLNLLLEPAALAATALLVLVAFLSKFLPAFTIGRLYDLPASDAAALGFLLNTRGLMELIVLQLGLQLGFISPAVYSMMVVMALTTTLLAAPALKRLQHHRPQTPNHGGFYRISP